jgi:hypothetical protein
MERDAQELVQLWFSDIWRQLKACDREETFLLEIIAQAQNRLTRLEKEREYKLTELERMRDLERAVPLPDVKITQHYLDAIHEE